MDSPRWCETCQAYGNHHTDRHTEMNGVPSIMALREEFYGDSKTIMVPMDLDATEGLVSALYDGAAVLDNGHHSDSPAQAELLRKCAERVIDARISAGLEA